MSSSNEKSIFLAALEKTTLGEREAFLAEACAGDERLRAEVDGLLRAHQRSDNVLDVVPTRVGFLRAQLEEATGIDFALTDSMSGASTITEGPGTIIGSYKLMEQIGEGGFGLVFVAEQQQPVRRKVALKVIKPGMDSRDVIARFEAERQALALMDHPNIAHVFDAGTTSSGRPYFVMELVRGVPITRFCEESGITIRERLELAIHVCHAVQHAHQKGVIHRDLKPANVLVTLHDGTPVVKVIDFGVAKAICDPLTTKTIYTRFAQVIGTPLYMSPEQVELSGLDVDTRSDIYSLGVLLYEMLTGTTPFDRQRLGSVSFDELRRIIREEEPPRPSTRLTTLGQQASTLAAERKLLARTPRLAVQGDLDWIVMKALEKDRRRRYETAAELAADVRRYLDQEPITARPPSPLYRFSKFARRQKAILTTVSLVALALVLGTAVSTWQAVQATTARAEADALRQEAVEFAEHLKQANVLLDNARANVDGERWAVAYRQYTKAAELQPDHYLVWSGRAALFVRLGLWQEAAADFARALELGAPANNPGWWGVPQLCLYTGNMDAYHAGSTRMFSQLKDSTDGFFKIMALRACLARANPEVDAGQLVQLAETLLIESDGRPFGPGPPGHPGRHHDGPPAPPAGPPPDGDFGRHRSAGVPKELPYYIAGLAHYRAGNAEKALQYSQASAEHGARWPTEALALPVLAMACHAAGQFDKAKVALGKANETLDQWISAMENDTARSLPVPWFDFVEYHLLCREACHLVTGVPLSDDHRLAALEQRGRELLKAP